SIMYAVRCTRPDVAFPQNLTSRFQQHPDRIRLRFEWRHSGLEEIAMSATKPEYIAASEVAMEAVWIRKFISGIERRQTLS
ncbi:hypothetical protein Tco_1189231, partial [Tanacetum coccineum]